VTPPPGPSSGVFVGGPIKTGFSATGFDPVLRELVVDLIRIIEDDGHLVTSAHRAEGFEVLPTESRRFVARRDLDWMVSAEVYVPVLPLGADGTPLPSLGTGVEIGWATMLGIPVIALIEDWARDRYTPLLTSLGSCCDVRILDLASVRHVPSRLSREIRDAKERRA
jgi:nucleoside 2-deoxyribosyltransferase